MKKYIFLILISSVLLASCKNVSSQHSEYILPELKSQEDHRAFLEELLNKDQNYRVAVNALDLKDENYEVNAQKVRYSIYYYDTLNLIKVEKYLKEHPYPSLKTYGDKISIAPLMVVHHQPSYSTARQDFFPVFYEAYINGDITPELFAFYLGRMHEVEKGTYYRMKSPYMIEDQIDSLIVQLGL